MNNVENEIKELENALDAKRKEANKLKNKEYEKLYKAMVGKYYINGHNGNSNKYYVLNFHPLYRHDGDVYYRFTVIQFDSYQVGYHNPDRADGLKNQKEHNYLCNGSSEISVHEWECWKFIDTVNEDYYEMKPDQIKKELKNFKDTFKKLVKLV